MKKFVAFSLCLAMVLPINTYAVGTTDSRTKPVDTMSKAEFADSLGSVPSANSQTATVNHAELLRDYYFDGFTNSEITELEENGIYLYSYQTSAEVEAERQLMPLGSGETTMTFVEQPAAAYVPEEDAWLVVAGGKWHDLSWVPFFGGKVGGYECVGYIFDNSNMSSLSSSSKPRIQEVIASLLSVTSDLDRDDREVVNYNLNIDEDEGVGSYMQDRSLLGGHYIGENYAIVVTYDNRFENVTGDLKSYYVHTDSGIELESVQLLPTVIGNKPIIVPVPTFNTEDYEFSQVSIPLELGN